MKFSAHIQLQQSHFNLQAKVELTDIGITAIYGPSGSGKTTLLRCIAGLIKPNNGHITLENTTWLDSKIHIPPHKRHIGYVFQESNLFPHLSIEKNIAFGAHRSKNPLNPKKIQALLDILEITPLLKHKVKNLSGGEQQRIAIARAIAANPVLLIMDEPLSHLDQELKKAFLPYILQIHKEFRLPIFYVSHSQDEISRIANNMIVMEKGTVKAVGKIEDIMTDLNIPWVKENLSGTMIKGRFQSYDHQYDLSHIDTPLGQLIVSENQSSLHDHIQLFIAAKDISITLNHSSHSSILNIFPVVIKDIVKTSRSQVLLKLQGNDCLLLGLITLKSCQNLGLKIDKKVFAQIKSVVLMH